MQRGALMIYKAYALIFDRSRSKMRSADEVTLVDAMHGTNLDARAATGAQVVVDGCEVILYGDSTVGAGLLTLHTADTAVGAVLTGECALILVGAFHNNTGGVVDKVNDAVGALAYADAASDALLGVNVCDTVLDRDSVLRANHSAVTVAEAGEGAEFIAAVCHIGGAAGLVTLVVVLSGCYVTGAVAGNVSNLFNNVLSGNAEDSRDLLSGTVTAGNAEIGLVGGFFRKSLSITVTSGISARAAVCTGQTVTDSQSGLILFHSEEYARYRKNNGADDTDAEKEKNGNKNL